jgi:hypothetical protein
MDVSIRRPKPDDRYIVGLRRFMPLLLLTMLLVGESLCPPAAYGFTISRVSFGNNVRLRADDIVDNGASLGRRSEQALDQGTLNASLNDLSQPLDIDISGSFVGGTLTASIDRQTAVTVSLSNSEHRDCLGDSDFSVRMRVIAPQDRFSAVGPDGGELRVVNFEPVFRGAQGAGCPRNLFYGYRMDLDVEDAVSAGTYTATAEVEVTSLAPGGGTEVVQVALEVQMPGILLLYHHSLINVDLKATALAGAFGANAVCSGGYCMDLGSRSVQVSDLSAPIPVGLAADVGSSFQPIQTITLRDAIGARAMGCSGNVYDTATYQVLNPVGGILPGGGVLTGIQSQPCGLTMRTGDLPLSLDLTGLDPVTRRASATIQITVTGL